MGRLERPSDKVTVRERPAGRIDSWKGIAAYLKRGARTVQRWEREAGLPVHRLHHDKLGSVYAYEDELEAWWSSRGSELESESAAEPWNGTSVGIAPFVDLSPEQDHAYFCEGIAEEITTALSRIAGLRVASQTPGAGPRRTMPGTKDLGRKLGVAAILLGSVRKSGSRLRISVRLLNSATGFQIWAETYDRGIGDVFAIQEEIALKVAESLKITLTAKEEAALERVPTRNTEAYDLYLRGRQYYYRHGPIDIEAAIQLFTNAIQRDPGFAMAYAGLADCWSYLYLYAEPRDAVREQAEWAGGLAVDLDPESAQAHVSRALALSLHGSKAEAQQDFETAIRIEPLLFEANYFFARHLAAAGDTRRSLELYERASQARPDDYQSPLLMAQIYDELGREPEGRSARLRGIELAEERLKLYPDDARAVYMAASGMAALGQRESAAELAARAIAMRPGDSLLLYNVGCVYAVLGNFDEALVALEQAIRNGLRQKQWFERDSHLQVLRKDRRFAGLMAMLAA
jgi:TolB-like protein